MDTVPGSDNSNTSPSQSGNIYQNTPVGAQSGTAHSAYEDVLHDVSSTQVAEEPISQPQEVNPPPPPASDMPPPPPPYIEDTRRKYLLFALFGGSILLLFLGIFLFLRSRRQVVKEPEAVTLTYWGLWEDEALLRPIIDEYQSAHPLIRVEYLKQNPNQYRQRLQAAIERGEGPDMFRFHNTWMPMVFSILAPVSQEIYPNAIFEQVFYPVVTEDVKIGDRYYGIPLEIDGLVLFYNEDILASAGVSVPKTWVDVQNSVPKLIVREGGKIVTAAIALGTAENIEHFSDILGLMMLQNGTQLSQSFFRCRDVNAKSCAIEALSFYRSFAESPNNGWDETLENSLLAFASGKVAMIFAPSWQAFSILALNPALHFKTAPVPQLPCESDSCLPVHWASYWIEGVSAKSTHQKEAWEFLAYLSQKETLQKLYELQSQQRQLFGEPFSRVDMGTLLADHPYVGAVIAQAPAMHSFALASRTYDGETGLNTSLITYLKDAVNALSAGVSPETALTTADAGFKQVFARFGIRIP